MPPTRSRRTPAPPAALDNSPRLSPSRQGASPQARMGDLWVEEMAHSIYQDERNARPASTTRSYEAKQRDWRAWCDKREFPAATLYTVTGPKLAAFLQEEVVGRRPRPRGPPPKDGSKRSAARARRKEATDGASAGMQQGEEAIQDHEQDQGDEGEAALAALMDDPLAKSVAPSTVSTYYAAVVDLYKLQRSLGTNSHPHPSETDAVKTVLNTTKMQRQQAKRDSYHDRGISTLNDGYSHRSQLAALLRTGWERKTGDGLRDMLCMALSHYALLRSHNTLELELPDLACLELEGEGESRCLAVLLILQHGKTNKHGRMEYGAFIRNKDVKVCPVGILAFYLFWRFHLANERFPPEDSIFPSLDSSRDWFDLKVIRSGKGPTDPLTSTTYSNAVKAAQKAAKISASALTHIFRKGGAILAELGGASKADIRQAGRWNTQVMERVYLTTLPRETMRSHAGFAASGREFYIKRDLPVPPELLAKIFPEVETWQRRFEAGNVQERTIAAASFLNLLSELRSVVLQDAAIMRLKYPDHPLFCHPVFASDSFRSFSDAMAIRLREAPDMPYHLEMERVLPGVASMIKTQHDATRSTIADLQAAVSEMRQADANSSSRILSYLGSLFSGAIPITLQAGVAIDHAASTINSGASQAAFGLAAEGSASATTSATPAASAARPVDFKMNRKIVTVEQAWREWKEGLVPGGPSVEAAYVKGTPSWAALKADGAEDRYYRRRLRVIQKVEQIMQAESVPALKAVAALEQFRVNQPNSSLAKLQELLNSDPDVHIPIYPVD